MFPMCPTLCFQFLIPYSMLTTKTSVSIQLPFLPIFPPCCPFPSGKGYSVLLNVCVCSGFVAYFLVFFSYIPYKSEIICICLSPSDVVHLVQYLKVHVFSQLAGFLSFLWPSSIPHLLLHSYGGHLNCFLDYCKQCFSDHWCTHIFSNQCLCILGINTQK